MKTTDSLQHSNLVNVCERQKLIMNILKWCDEEIMQALGNNVSNGLTHGF